MKKVLRTVQPPHKSKTLTVAQARKAILKVKAEEEAKRNRRKSQQNRPTELAPWSAGCPPASAPHAAQLRQ